MTSRPLPFAANVRRMPFFGRAGLSARVGGSKIETPSFRANEAEFRAYLQRIDEAIESLWVDIKAQIVWIDPADLSKWGSGPMVDEITARAKSHGPKRSAAEIDYARGFTKLRADWQDAKEALTLGLDGTAPPGAPTFTATMTDRWNGIRPWHEKHNGKLADFRDLGGEPSATSDPGPVPDQITKSPDDVLKKTASLIPWWVWPAVIVVGGAVLFVYAAPLLAVRKTLGPARVTP